MSAHCKEPERDIVASVERALENSLSEEEYISAVQNVREYLAKSGMADPAAEIAALRECSEALRWLEENGASLTFASQPDMGGYNWRVSHPLIPTSCRIRGRTPLLAIEEARQALNSLNQAHAADER